MSADNVVDLLQARMRKLPANVQLLLQYAACLGSSFSASTLDLIWREQFVMKADYTTDTITNLLAVEAALSLSGTVTPAFQFEIGTALFHSLNANDLEEQAAKKAKKISAFQSAAKYAANIELLPSDKWTTHRSLTLALYTIGSELEFALGRSESAERYSNEVLNRKECTMMEMLPLKMAKSLKLCTVDLKFKETVQIILGLLKDLGVKLLWSRATAPLQSVATLSRTLKMAKKVPAPEDIFEKRDHMRDPKHRVAMLLLMLCMLSD
eukprot:scaffold20461_cov117-Cylindrotheca_fusiformis.AAC.8